MANIRVEPITSAEDIPTCAQVCTDAVQSDSFITFMNRYSTQNFYDSTVCKMTDAVNPENTTDFAFKAVERTENEHGEIQEEIVGVAHWYVGYAIVPKIDPFAKKPVASTGEIGPEEVAVGDENEVAARSAPSLSARKAKAVMDEMYREHGNLYIGNIRGKKHVCKS
jgi:hypothetical protein